jgi:hypothetical protein
MISQRGMMLRAWRYRDTERGASTSSASRARMAGWMIAMGVAYRAGYGARWCVEKRSVEAPRYPSGIGGGWMGGTVSWSAYRTRWMWT